jgi:hypothetical protein
MKCSNCRATTTLKHPQLDYQQAIGVVLETPVAMHADWDRELRTGSNMIW